MVLCIVAGVISNGSLHIGPMLYVADAIHFFTLLYYTWAPLRELGNVQRRLDSEHGNPADAYLRTMRFGFFVVCAFAVISPLYILSRPLLFVFGPLGLISLSLFIVSFTALGFSMSEGVTEIVTETNDEIAAAKVFREIGPERIAEIDMAVSKWRSEGGFRGRRVKRPFTNAACGVTFVPENRKITCPFRNLCSFLASSGVPDLPPAASFWE